MRARLKSHDRRGVGRPRNGDTKPCPLCGKASCEFNDHFRFEGAIVPAWVCDAPQCQYREVVRQGARSTVADSIDAIRGSRNVQARARRTIMKSLACTARSRKRHSKPPKSVK
jgi:hypothetical protein